MLAEHYPVVTRRAGQLRVDEIKAIMGGNAIRTLDFDGAEIDAIAARVGSSMDAIFGEYPPLSFDLFARFAQRGQYLGEPEGKSWRLKWLLHFVNRTGPGQRDCHRISEAQPGPA
jgi:hypothetical protein